MKCVTTLVERGQLFDEKLNLIQNLGILNFFENFSDKTGDIEFLKTASDLADSVLEELISLEIESRGNADEQTLLKQQLICQMISKVFQFI